MLLSKMQLCYLLLCYLLLCCLLPWFMLLLYLVNVTWYYVTWYYQPEKKTRKRHNTYSTPDSAAPALLSCGAPNDIARIFCTALECVCKFLLSFSLVNTNLFLTKWQRRWQPSFLAIATSLAGRMMLTTAPRADIVGNSPSSQLFVQSSVAATVNLLSAGEALQKNGKSAIEHCHLELAIQNLNDQERHIPSRLKTTRR